MALTKVRPEGLGFVNGKRNLIINGAMQVAQRGTSFSSAANNTYVVDRFRVKRNGMDELVYDLSQSSTSPDGFGNSIKLDVTTAETSSADGEYLKIDTTIEAQNVQQLKYGTSSAEQITMSFWVRSSLTGTFAGSVINSARNKSRVFEYTINTANTWEHKTVSFVGDTTGTWLTTSGKGVSLRFSFGAAGTWLQDAGSWSTGNVTASSGSVNLVATNNATLYLTGVQLEVGDTATPFEHRSYGDELAKCQRYYQSFVNPMLVGDVPDNSNRIYNVGMIFQPQMRSTPTFALFNTGTLSGQFVSDGQSTASISSILSTGGTKYGMELNFNISTDLVNYRSANFTGGGSTTRQTTYTFDAEL